MEYEFSFDNLNTIRSFSGRIKYCRQHLKHLGTGSSRTVFELPDGRALKVAHNGKGISQNDVEGDFGLRAMYPELVVSLHDAEDDGKWIVVDRLNRVKMDELLAYFDVEQDVLKLLLRGIDCYINEYETAQLDQARELLPEDSVLHDVVEMCINFDILGGDLSRASSWGRTSQGDIQLLDIGLTREVYHTHYRRMGPGQPQGAQRGFGLI